MKHLKTGQVSLIGKPNVGKSSLINSIMEQKLVIVSDKPQTTWHRINCIYTDEEYQIIFSDTPGIHKPLSKVNSYMLKAAKGALEGTDLVLWLFDAQRGVTRAEDYVYEVIKDSGNHIFAVINKIDLVEEEIIGNTVDRIKNKYGLEEIFTVSAVKNLGIPDLMRGIKDRLQDGPVFYDAETLVDKSSKFLISEIIREKIFRYTSEEIPYSCAVFVEHFEEKQNGNLYVRAEIYVERMSQKGMIIGKGGELVKKIRLNSKKDIEYMFDGKVELELFVKFKKDWRERDSVLSEDLYFGEDL